VRKKIGECLIQAGLITEDDLQIALAEHKRTGERIGSALVRLNFASEKQVSKALAYQLGFPYANLSEEPPDPDAIILIPREISLNMVCVAVRVDTNLLTVAMSDPLLFSLVQDLEFRTGLRIRQVVATRTDILSSIERIYPETSAPRGGGYDEAITDLPPAAGRRSRKDSFDQAAAARTGENSESTRIIHLVDLVVNGAITSGASDLHIEPQERGVLVRHRLDGLLKEVMDLPKWVHEGLVARIKVLAGMDVAERRLPQDGRLRLKQQDGRDADLRVSTLRTRHGEKIVIRVLDRHKQAPPLETLGFSPAALDGVTHLLKQQRGLVLVTGPAGSGKTTTLGSAISSIASRKPNIVALEDPIEYEIPGVNQVQVNDKGSLTFASALRAVLRQDPDVVLVGEIPDEETARNVLQAAQSGHLVLSRLQTDDGPSAITRLIDMGIQPYILASALVGIVAQQLVRRLCTSCRRQHAPDGETLRALNLTEEAAAQLTLYQAVGCGECHGTGYRDRIAIYEVMRVTETVRRLIAQNAGEERVRDAASADGMVTLAADGLAKVKSGVTTPEELLRVVAEPRAHQRLCPACAAPLAPDFMACPDCGHRLNPGCVNCGRALQPGWQFCPFCATSLAPMPSRKKLPETVKPTDVPLTKVAEFKNPGR
jgi:type IV pilus assembly protein PilB